MATPTNNRAKPRHGSSAWAISFRLSRASHHRYSRGKLWWDARDRRPFTHVLVGAGTRVGGPHPLRRSGCVQNHARPLFQPALRRSASSGRSRVAGVTTFRLCQSSPRPGGDGIPATRLSVMPGRSPLHSSGCDWANQKGTLRPRTKAGSKRCPSYLPQRGKTMTITVHHAAAERLRHMPHHPTSDQTEQSERSSWPIRIYILLAIVGLAVGFTIGYVTLAFWWMWWL